MRCYGLIFSLKRCDSAVPDSKCVHVYISETRLWPRLCYWLQLPVRWSEQRHSQAAAAAFNLGPSKKKKNTQPNCSPNTEVCFQPPSCQLSVQPAHSGGFSLGLTIPRTHNTLAPEKMTDIDTASPFQINSWTWSNLLSRVNQCVLSLDLVSNSLAFFNFYIFS